MPKRVVIVGGGITGLSAAFYLAQCNSKLQIVLIEKTSRLGGIIQTTLDNGFLIEHGPEAMVRTKPGAIQLCRDLKLENTLIEPKSENNKTYLYIDEQLVEFPIQSILQKLRIAIKNQSHSQLDKTIRELVLENEGIDFYENQAEPLLSGIYGLNPGELSAIAILKSIKSGPKSKSTLVSLKEGMNTLIHRLSEQLAKLGVEIRLNTAIKILHPTAYGWKLKPEGKKEYIESQAVLLTVPAWVSASLVAQWEPKLSMLLNRIPYRSASVFTFAFPKIAVRHGLKGYGFLVHPREKLNFTACTWTSSKWPFRVAKQNVLLRVYVPKFSANPEKMKINILQDLKSIIKIKEKPCGFWHHAYFQASPYYSLGHDKTVQEIHQFRQSTPGLFLAGAAFHGLGIADCVQDAKKTAKNMLKYFSRACLD